MRGADGVRAAVGARRGRQPPRLLDRAAAAGSSAERVRGAVGNATGVPVETDGRHRNRRRARGDAGGHSRPTARRHGSRLRVPERDHDHARADPNIGCGDEHHGRNSRSGRRKTLVRESDHPACQCASGDCGGRCRGGGGRGERGARRGNPRGDRHAPGPVAIGAVEPGVRAQRGRTARHRRGHPRRRAAPVAAELRRWQRVGAVHHRRALRPDGLQRNRQRLRGVHHQPARRRRARHPGAGERQAPRDVGSAGRLRGHLQHPAPPGRPGRDRDGRRLRHLRWRRRWRRGQHRPARRLRRSHGEPPARCPDRRRIPAAQRVGRGDPELGARATFRRVHVPRTHHARLGRQPAQALPGRLVQKLLHGRGHGARRSLPGRAHRLAVGARRPRRVERLDPGGPGRHGPDARRLRRHRGRSCHRRRRLLGVRSVPGTIRLHAPAGPEPGVRRRLARLVGALCAALDDDAPLGDETDAAGPGDQPLQSVRRSRARAACQRTSPGADGSPRRERQMERRCQPRRQLRGRALRLEVDRRHALRPRPRHRPDHQRLRVPRDPTRGERPLPEPVRRQPGCGQLAGPSGAVRDSNWRFRHLERGNRLLGTRHRTVVLAPGGRSAVGARRRLPGQPVGAVGVQGHAEQPDSGGPGRRGGHLPRRHRQGFQRRPRLRRHRGRRSRRGRDVRPEGQPGLPQRIRRNAHTGAGEPGLPGQPRGGESRRAPRGRRELRRA